MLLIIVWMLLRIFFFIWDQFLVDLFIGFLFFKKIFSNNHRWNYIWYFFKGNIDGMKRDFFFLPFISVNPSVVIFFYYQRTYRRKKNYRQKIHWQSISVCDSVDKLITNGMIVHILMEISVGKYKNSVSDYFHKMRIISIFFLNG